MTQVMSMRPDGPVQSRLAAFPCAQTKGKTNARCRNAVFTLVNVSGQSRSRVRCPAHASGNLYEHGDRPAGGRHPLEHRGRGRGFYSRPDRLPCLRRAERVLLQGTAGGSRQCSGLRRAITGMKRQSEIPARLRALIEDLNEDWQAARCRHRRNHGRDRGSRQNAPSA
jgi:hypothetical protein